MYFIKRLSDRNLIILLFGDIVIVSIAFYLSILFRFDFIIPYELADFLVWENYSILLLIKIFSFRIFALYRGMWRYTSVWDMLNIVKGNILASLLIISAVAFFIGFHNVILIFKHDV